ncbi:MAG: endonuclease/exonuclease/phosphatase family protein [bacterium]
MLRIATYNPELSRQGPGLLLQAIRGRNDDQVQAAVAVLTRLDADVVLLTGFDYDYGQAALTAFAADLGEAGLTYPYHLALRPNTGVPTGLDLDGNGRLGEARDAQGYGRFAGAAGMAVLSRFPLGEPTDYSGLLWQDLPGADLPPDMTDAAKAVQLLSTSGHYQVPVTYADGKVLALLVWYATPPVFDGAEDRNGRRYHDEAAFWLRLLAGDLPYPPPQHPFVLLGQSNLDPIDGDGLHDAIAALLTSPALQDPQPRGNSGHSDPGQHGDPALDTAFYPKGVGGLRVEVILPQAALNVTAAGVLWPAAGDPFAATLSAASRHRPVWVAIDLP